VYSLPSLSLTDEAVELFCDRARHARADFTVTDNTTAPVYAAKIRVHIAYGFMSLHKLDLEAGTNAAGKARFTGLPDKTKQGLFFRASEGDREGSAFDDPVKTCKAEFTIVLVKKPQ